MTGDAIARMSGGTRARKEEGCSSPQLCSQAVGEKHCWNGSPVPLTCSSLVMPFVEDGVEFGRALSPH